MIITRYVFWTSMKAIAFWKLEKNFVTIQNQFSKKGFPRGGSVWFLTEKLNFSCINDHILPLVLNSAQHTVEKPCYSEIIVYLIEDFDFAPFAKKKKTQNSNPLLMLKIAAERFDVLLHNIQGWTFRKAHFHPLTLSPSGGKFISVTSQAYACDPQSPWKLLPALKRS